MSQDTWGKLDRESDLECHDRFCGIEAIVDLTRRN